MVHEDLGWTMKGPLHWKIYFVPLYLSPHVDLAGNDNIEAHIEINVKTTIKGLTKINLWAHFTNNFKNRKQRGGVRKVKERRNERGTERKFHHSL